MNLDSGLRSLIEFLYSARNGETRKGKLLSLLPVLSHSVLMCDNDEKVFSKSSGEMTLIDELKKKDYDEEVSSSPIAQITASTGLQEADLIGLQEADIRLGLKRKGYIRNVLVVSRPNKIRHVFEYVVWVHPSWVRGFYPFCTHRGRSMRSYKDPSLFFVHCRDDWGYRGGIIVRTHDDPKILLLQAAAVSRANRKIAELVGNEALLD